MDGAKPASRLLAVILASDGATLFPGEDGSSFDVVSLQILNVIGLTYGLDQGAHLVWELGNEDHGLEVGRNGAFGCSHPGKADEDGVNGESGVSVPRDYDVHCHLKFFIGGSDSRFAVGRFEGLPCYGSEHGVDVCVLLNGFLEEV